MRPFLFAASAALALSTQAQELSEDFDSGTLGDGWFWTGNEPQFAPGHDSPWSIAKESKDLCTPPLAEVWGMPFLFHPIPYDADLYYSVTADVRIEGGDKEGNIARVGMGWLDRTGGYSFFYDNAETGSHTWTTLTLVPKQYQPGFPNSEFGVVLHLDAAATEAHGLFDEIRVKAVSSPTGIDDLAGRAAMTVAPNPANDRLQVTLPPDLRPLAVHLIDGQGRIVRDLGPQRGGPLQVDLSGVPEGVYVLQVTHADGVLSQRVVKG